MLLNFLSIALSKKAIFALLILICSLQEINLSKIGCTFGRYIRIKEYGIASDDIMLCRGYKSHSETFKIYVFLIISFSHVVEHSFGQ